MFGLDWNGCCITDLDISHNKLNWAKGTPTAVVNLNISHNQLKSLRGIHKCSQLRTLNASHNNIVDVNAEIVEEEKP